MGSCRRRHRERTAFSRHHEKGLILLELPTCAKCVSQLAPLVTGVRRLVRMQREQASLPTPSVPVFHLSGVLTGILQFSVTQFQAQLHSMLLKATPQVQELWEFPLRVSLRWQVWVWVLVALPLDLCLLYPPSWWATHRSKVCAIGDWTLLWVRYQTWFLCLFNKIQNIPFPCSPVYSGYYFLTSQSLFKVSVSLAKLSTSCSRDPAIFLRHLAECLVCNKG